MASCQGFCASPTIQLVKKRRPFLKRNVLKCAATTSLDAKAKKEDLGSDDTKFSAWATANKIDMSSVTLRTFGREAEILGSRGMAANKVLKKGDQLMSVAKSATLQVNTLDRGRTPIPGSICKETWSRLPWFARLAMLIVHAKQQPDSPLNPWTNRLPTEFQTPFHWSEKELSELQSPRMTMAVHNERKLYRKLFDDVNGNAENGIALTYAEFVWAVQCVRSRAFSGPLEVAPFKERLQLFLFILANTLGLPLLHVLPWENALNGGLTALFALTMYDILLPKILKVVQGVQLKRYAMTPGIDFLNHNSSVAGIAEVSYEYFSDKFVVQSGLDYKESEQVFISYGAQSNDSFLQYYGFVEENNPSETYTFGSDREKVLGVKEGSLIARNSGFDDATVSAVANAFEGKKESASTALRELCDAELSGMSTTLEEDIGLLQTEDIEKHARRALAIRYRIEKKKLLRSLSSTP